MGNLDPQLDKEVREFVNGLSRKDCAYTTELCLHKMKKNLEARWAWIFTKAIIYITQVVFCYMIFTGHSHAVSAGISILFLSGVNLIYVDKRVKLLRKRFKLQTAILQNIREKYNALQD